MKHRLNPNKFLYLRSFFRRLEASYHDLCCDAEPSALDLSDYTKLIEELSTKIQNKELSPSDLSPDLIEQIYKDISQPVKKEFGRKWVDYDYKEPNNLIQKFKKNLWQFSSAKTLAELEMINSLILDKNGRIKPEYQFKQDLQKMNFQFNRNYLNAEYQTAKRGSQMSHLWTKIQ